MNAKREISFHHVDGNALKYNRNCIKIDKCWLGWRNGRLFIAITNTIFHKQPGETINGKGNYISHLICNLFYINIEWRMKDATDTQLWTIIFGSSDIFIAYTDALLLCVVCSISAVEKNIELFWKRIRFEWNEIGYRPK